MFTNTANRVALAAGVVLFALTVVLVITGDAHSVGERLADSGGFGGIGTLYGMFR